MHYSGEYFDVAIAGAGPAGTSAAIHLANGGARVLLVEQKTFPRAKLCGEFISPECVYHFERLGVTAPMISSGAASLTRTTFYSRNGESVAVPSEWFGISSLALGLSRAEMDNNLLERAKQAGVVVWEDTVVSDLLLSERQVRGIKLTKADQTFNCSALVTIDATGRTRSLARRLDPMSFHLSPTRRLVAFKTHLENTRVAEGACEIYFYPGGYGGLSSIENGLSNLCFIADAKDVRRCESNPTRVLQNIVRKNARAAHTLARARTHTDWLAVSLDHFGRRTPVPADGLMTIGDAAAFIDPFTGSGMLMALENGEVAAHSIISHLAALRRGDSFKPLAHDYRKRYSRKFNSRLRISGLLRRAAFIPEFARAAIRVTSASDRVRRRLARATRGGSAAGMANEKTRHK